MKFTDDFPEMSFRRPTTEIGGTAPSSARESYYRRSAALSNLRKSSIFLRAHFGSQALLGRSKIRRIGLEKLADMERMRNDLTLKLFGPVDLENMLYDSFLSLGIENEGTLMAAVCFNHTPNVPSIPTWAWGRWLRTLYPLDNISHMNSMFIHFAVWDVRMALIFMKPMLMYVFKEYLNLEHVLLLKPPGQISTTFMDIYSTRVYPRGNYYPESVMSICMANRSGFHNGYKIRKAVEEDNDDIVPLIHRYSKHFRQLYGDYYVTELLQLQKNSGREIIVAEYNDTPVAVTILNDTLNVDVLINEFELLLYNGLKIQTDERIVDKITKQLQAEKMEDDTLLEHPTTSITSKKPSIRKEESKSISEDARSESEIISTSSEESSTSLDYLDEDADYSIENMSYIMDLEGAHGSKDGSTTTSEESTSGSLFSNVLLSFQGSSRQAHLIAGEEARLKKIMKNKERKKGSIFQGEDSAFAVEVAAAHPIHEFILHFLFQAAFERYPNKEYQVMTIPSTVVRPEFIRSFVRVPPKPDGTFPHELYIMHRSSANPDMFVRMTHLRDEEPLEDYFKQIVKAEHLFDLYMCSLDPDETMMSFVMLCSLHVVGFAVIDEDLNLEYIYSHYDVCYWISEHRHKRGDVAKLLTLVVSPVFHYYATYFLSEIHRLADYSVLLYCLHPNATMVQREIPVVNVLQYMVPVMPRTIQEFDPEVIKEYGICDCITREEPPFSLYLSTVGLCGRSICEINYKIVVVGFGEIACAFLQRLIYTQSPQIMINFTNVTVISPHGIGVLRNQNKVRNMMFVYNGQFQRKHMHLMALKNHLNCVNGVMTGIDRKEKRIFVNDDSYVAYDILMITCGEQFHKPANQLSKEKRKNRPEFPLNIFIVNTPVDASNSLTKVKELADNSVTGYVIVYGHQLVAHCCLAALLELGIPPEKLAYVDPYVKTLSLETLSSGHRLIYNDPEIEQTIINIMKDLGIKVYPNYVFSEWFMDYETNFVNTVKFESKHHMLELDCIGFFIYDEKSVSMRTLNAILKSGLVYDGRLVIDNKCRTNDPNIYAAGPITKYSRKYYADHMSHCYFNSEEVGTKLAEDLRMLLIPHKYQERVKEELKFPIKVEHDDDLVHCYQKPIIQYCQLPGNLYYLSVTKPGRQSALEIAIVKENFGQLIVTGDAKDLDRQGYFKLHLNHFKKVEMITCLSKTPLDVQNLIALWGKHEKLLNNLSLRFEMMLITDLFQFFKEPWASALYHDRYQSFEEEIDNIETEESFYGTLASRVMDIHRDRNWKALTPEDKNQINELFEELKVESSIETKLINFIMENSDYLAMYAHPGHTLNLMKELDKSPMFEKKDSKKKPE